MRAEIFIGVVYYQRLRHMVSDKSQVRGTGPVHPLTQQPIKGRKRHGGIRLGEMERDALLAHGTSILLHDRLVLCSDSHAACICMNEQCGTLHSEFIPNAVEITECKECGSRKCAVHPIPYVFRYLKNELAGMNIQLRLLLHE